MGYLSVAVVSAAFSLSFLISAWLSRLGRGRLPISILAAVGGFLLAYFASIFLGVALRAPIDKAMGWASFAIIGAPFGAIKGHKAGKKLGASVSTQAPATAEPLVSAKKLSFIGRLDSVSKRIFFLVSAVGIFTLIFVYFLKWVDPYDYDETRLATWFSALALIIIGLLGSFGQNLCVALYAATLGRLFDWIKNG